MVEQRENPTRNEEILFMNRILFYSIAVFTKQCTLEVSHISSLNFRFFIGKIISVPFN